MWDGSIYIYCHEAIWLSALGALSIIQAKRGREERVVFGKCACEDITTCFWVFCSEGIILEVGRAA